MTESRDCKPSVDLLRHYQGQKRKVLRVEALLSLVTEATHVQKPTKIPKIL